MSVELIDINRIKANPKNPRIIKDDKFERLVKSIQDFPDMLHKRPLICFTDRDNKLVVLGGNMRLKALNHLKIKSVPVILADEWTEEQKNEFLIKDNLNFGSWEWDNLANEWDSEKLNEWGLEVPNIEEIDVDQFFKEADRMNENPETFDIILEFTEEDYHDAVELFSKRSGSREKIVLELLRK